MPPPPRNPATKSNATANGRGSGFRAACNQLVLQFQQQRPQRAGSLLITVFGDAIAPRGGSVWLGSLIEALNPFGINQRSVRTCVFRLTRDDWLISMPVGRRSYYSLSADGRLRFREASRRIYSEPRKAWSGSWCLVILSGAPPSARESIRKELAWMGFAPFSSNVMAHPAPDETAVEERLAKLEYNDRLLVMQARADADRVDYLRNLVHGAWSLDALAQEYADFLKRFRRVYRAASRTQGLSPEHAFRVRTLLIHDYRKMLLRDPHLPEALLPERWDGVAAYQLCRNLYTLVFAPAEAYLSEHMETADGPLPPSEPAFYQRFGGLPETAAP